MSKVPTETVLLPSKGHIYPETHPLSAGKIEMQYMTAKHEDILTNRNYIRDGSVLDKLLKALIVAPENINLEDLLIADKNAILIAARILGYGKDYEFKYSDSRGSESLTAKIDLTTLDEKVLDTNLCPKGVNEFQYTLPVTGNLVTFKLLTVGDDKKINDEIEGIKKISQTLSNESTTYLKHIITSVEDKRDTASIRDFVDNFLIAKDARSLRLYYHEVNPDIDLTYKPAGYTGEGIRIPLLNFFWPDARI